MTLMLRKGRYTARFATTEADIDRALRLRHLSFLERGTATARPGGRDRDAFDRTSRHVLVEATHGDDMPAATFRYAPCAGPRDVNMSYAAQFYDIEPFLREFRSAAELGRFCIHPDAQDGEALRVAWGALAGLVQEDGIKVLFGCASFSGADPARHSAALAYLHRNHLGPARTRPRATAPQTLALKTLAAGPPRAALAQMPALLRSYVSMGGWISDGAVIDRDLDTLHVFAALEIAKVPPSRARSLLSIGA